MREMNFLPAIAPEWLLAGQKPVDVLWKQASAIVWTGFYESGFGNGIWPPMNRKADRTCAASIVAFSLRIFDNDGKVFD